MRKLLLSIIASMISVGLYAQDVQWAKEVLDYSSQLDETQYSAKQILGNPNIYPWGNGNPNAWTPRRPNKEEFVKVSFETPEQIRQVAIVESYNPSTITAIYYYDENDNEYLVFEREPQVVNQPGRFLRLFTELTEYKVAAVKITFDGGAVPGYFSIDAIGISPSNTPIDIELELAPNIREDVLAEVLDERVNSPYDELAPLVSPNGRQLFFGRKFHPDNMGGEEDFEDIWVSDLDTISNEWQEARNLGAPLNNKGPNFISSITPDGNTLVVLLGNQYTEKSDKMYSGVSVSSKVGDGWSQPENIEIENYYNYSDKANFYLANNRKTLLMSVERDDSFGDRDLYVSFLKRDSSWSEPLNLGNTLNTATAETAPFLAADDKTLFFSTEGGIGFGGNDVYMSKRLDDSWQNWSEPVNMGPQVNSAGDDLFFNMPPIGDFAYYTKEDSTGDMDIYKIKMPIFYEVDPVITINGRVFDGKAQRPLSAIVSYEDLETGEEIGRVETDPTTGEYQIALPAGKEYQYVAKVKGYLPVSERIDLRNQRESKAFNNDLVMVEIEKEAEITLNNIYFNFDSDQLLSKSKSELDRMYEVMKENEDIEVLITGHADSTGPESYNQGLSERRAQSVVNYLTNKGIDSDRLSAEGKGESEPLVPNTSIENRAKNRRVNFKIE